MAGRKLFLTPVVDLLPADIAARPFGDAPRLRVLVEWSLPRAPEPTLTSKTTSRSSRRAIAASIRPSEERLQGVLMIPSLPSMSRSPRAIAAWRSSRPIRALERVDERAALRQRIGSPRTFVRKLAVSEASECSKKVDERFRRVVLELPVHGRLALVESLGGGAPVVEEDVLIRRRRDPSTSRSRP